MTHCMKLNPEPFRKIACGYKTIELRLNDEKRQAVQLGDRGKDSLRLGGTY